MEERKLLESHASEQAAAIRKRQWAWAVHRSRAAVERGILRSALRAWFRGVRADVELRAALAQLRKLWAERTARDALLAWRLSTREQAAWRAGGGPDEQPGGEGRSWGDEYGSRRDVLLAWAALLDERDRHLSRVRKAISMVRARRSPQPLFIPAPPCPPSLSNRKTTK